MTTAKIDELIRVIAGVRAFCAGATDSIEGYAARAITRHALHKPQITIVDAQRWRAADLSMADALDALATAAANEAKQLRDALMPREGEQQ